LSYFLFLSKNTRTNIGKIFDNANNTIDITDEKPIAAVAN